MEIGNSSFKSVLKRFLHVFSRNDYDLGTIDIEQHEIKLKEGATFKH